MLETTFSQELVLSVVDKVALVALAVLGYWLGRRQERIKAREELQKVRSEEGRTAILNQWDGVRYLHFDTVDVWTGTAQGGHITDARKAEAERLVARAHEVRRAVRDHRRLLGQTIAEAMYASIRKDLQAAKTVADGQIPPTYEYENAEVEWLKQVLDEMDVDEFALSRDGNTHADNPYALIHAGTEKKKQEKESRVAVSAPMG